MTGQFVGYVGQSLSLFMQANQRFFKVRIQTSTVAVRSDGGYLQEVLGHASTEQRIDIGVVLWTRQIT